MFDCNQKSYISNHKSPGFTLVELLVVITIIGILIALLLPAVQAAREAARRMNCANNFKQVALALHNYHTTIGCFPPGMFNDYSTKYTNAPGRFGWAIYILPYMELRNLYDRYDFRRPATFWKDYDQIGTNNRTVSGTKISGYLCPSDPTEGEGVKVSGTILVPQVGMTNICAVSDSTLYYDSSSSSSYPMWDFPTNDGIFGANVGCRIADIRDGTSNTLMIGEVAGSGKGRYSSRFWASWDLGDVHDGINGITTVPGGATSTDNKTIGFSSFHPGGCHFALADGSVGFASQEIADAVLKALVTRDASYRRYTNPTSEVLVNGMP